MGKVFYEYFGNNDVTKYVLLSHVDCIGGEGYFLFGTNVQEFKLHELLLFIGSEE